MDKVILPHLETNITTACTNSCTGCNHFIPLQSPSYIRADDLARDLDTFGRVAHADTYALLGGEPLLHPDLIELLKISRASGIADRIEVITNGSLLHRVPDAFWGLVDILTVSMYPGKKVRDGWLEKAHSNQIEVRTKNVSLEPFCAPLRKYPTDAEAVFDQCWYRSYCYVLDGGHFYRCCMSPFIPSVIMGLPKETDGISVTGLTADRLKTFIASPALSCAVCGAHNGPRLAYSETRDRDEWLDRSRL